MLDARKVEPGISLETDRDTVEAIHRLGAVGKCRQYSGRTICRVSHGGVDLARGRVAGVLRHQLGERTILLAQCGEYVQRREHAGVGAPEVAEVVVSGVLAAEHRTGLGHLLLDERVADSGTNSDAAEFFEPVRALPVT